MVMFYLHIHSHVVTHNIILAASLKSNTSGEVDSNYFPKLKESRLVKDTSRARLRFFNPFMGSLHFSIQAVGQTQHQLVGSQDS